MRHRILRLTHLCHCTLYSVPSAVLFYAKIRVIMMVYTELTARSLILTFNDAIKSLTPWHSIARCPVPATLALAPQRKPRENTNSVEKDKFMYQLIKSAYKACSSNQSKRKADGRIWATAGEIIFLGEEKICNLSWSRGSCSRAAS